MKQEDARQLVEIARILRHPCDLDLLVFFARHPRALVTGELLAKFLGYDPSQIADSLELLLDAGLLTRSQTPTHAARLYVFTVDGSNGGWAPTLVARASTRAGRLALIQAMANRPNAEGSGLDLAATPLDGPEPRLFVVPRQAPSKFGKTG